MNSNTIHFKKVNTESINKIQSIAHITWPDTFKGLLTDNQIEYMVEHMYSNSSLIEQMSKLGHQFIIAYDNEEAIGYASYELNYNDLPHLMIHKAYILPSYQGKGIGKKLFDFLSNVALNKNQKNLRLQVFHKNEKAIKFYLKNDFKNVGNADKDLGEGYVFLDYIMLKDLKN